jgi:2-methylcitrate dehydratase PrpD
MPATRAGLSDAIAEHVASLSYDALSPAARHAARRALLDATGVMLAASGLSPEVEPFIRLARSTGRGGPCTLLGCGDRVQAPQAAFANGAMAHALDFEDAFDRAPVHPNAASIPAAIALAQAHGPIPGRELVTAVALGCDLACRVGLSLRQRLEDGGWYPPILLGGIGAAATAARLLGSTPAQVRDSLSLALCQITAPGEIKHSAGSVIRAVREAFPAQAAVVSALLARAGVAGFEQPLEGADAFYRLYAGGRYEAADVLAGLGEINLIEQLSFKPWPCCRGTHAYIQIALELAREHGFTAADVTAVAVDTGPIQAMLVEPLARKQAPQTAIDAKFSIPFTLAVALVRGRVALEDFAAEARADPNVLALARRVTPTSNRDWGTQHATHGALSIELVDGRVLSGATAEPLGSPARPMSDADLIGKFVDCCAHAARPLSAGEAEAAAARILAIDELQDSGSCFRLGDD